MKNLPIIENVHFERSPERLKIVLPVKRNMLLIALFTFMLIIWIIGLIWAIQFTIQDAALSGERFAVLFTIMMLVWLYIWVRLGKLLWKYWQYNVSNREILFINKEELIIRRPVSILGITTTYDMEHVTPFHFGKKHQAPTFTYGPRPIPFGQALTDQSARRLIITLNDAYFPDLDEEDWDEEE